MAWIELHQALVRHPKLIRLATLAGFADRDLARAKLENLWLWCLDYRLNGNLTGFSAADLAAASNVTCDANIWLKSLIECGFVDDFGDGVLKLHDWHQYAGKLIKVRKDNKLRAKRWRERNALRNGDERVRAPYTVPNRTVPNRTVPEEKDIAADAAHSDPSGVRGVAQKLLDLWNHGRPEREWIKATRKREAKVAARLKDGFSEEQLVKAVVNCLESEWHQGGNDRGWRAPGPEWVLNSMERVEEWISKQKPKSRDEVVMELLKKSVDEEERRNAAQS